MNVPVFIEIEVEEQADEGNNKDDDVEFLWVK